MKEGTSGAWFTAVNQGCKTRWVTEVGECCGCISGGRRLVYRGKLVKHQEWCYLL